MFPSILFPCSATVNMFKYTVPWRIRRQPSRVSTQNLNNSSIRSIIARAQSTRSHYILPICLIQIICWSYFQTVFSSWVNHWMTLEEKKHWTRKGIALVSFYKLIPIDECFIFISCCLVHLSYDEPNMSELCLLLRKGKLTIWFVIWFQQAYPSRLVIYCTEN